MIFFGVAVIFPVLPIVLGRFLRPIKYGKSKMRPYECGIDPTTEAHERFTVRYYIVAMLFLIFDVETIFLLPVGDHLHGRRLLVHEVCAD